MPRARLGSSFGSWGQLEQKAVNAQAMTQPGTGMAAAGAPWQFEDLLPDSQRCHQLCPGG